ncbi:MAG: hypothetical protein WEG36_16485 [Gemmatimonadota bacterium]
MPVFLLLLIALATLILVNPEAAPPPPPPQPAPANGVALFATSENCLLCHNGIVSSKGEDVSIGADWRATMMAHAAKDPYWQAAVRREITDHPTAAAAIEDKCSTCHMPMARYEAHLGGGSGEVFGNLPVGSSAERGPVLAEDGVSCTVCHQIVDEGLGDPSTFTGGFAVDETTPWGERSMFGPFTTDLGRAGIMHSATGFTPREALHIQSSELCASCHTLYTETLDAEGRQIGELPEQVPYLEWQHSAYPAQDVQCQSCHMPVVSEPVAVTRVLGQPRDEVSRHIFLGGNFFVLGMLNRYRDELGVEALPHEMDRAQRRMVEHLQTDAARVRIEEIEAGDGRVAATVSIENLGGHKLPTAYPSRRAWLHVTVRDGAGRIVFESGAFRPDGSIMGNDLDAGGDGFEPHYETIESPDQVQVYETVMVDVDDSVTTGLLRGIRFAKDNRILPLGFDVTTAPEDVAVRGGATEDADFTGGSDRIQYDVSVGGAQGPYTVEAALWFQPVSYRWARELDPYDAFETRRFVDYYDAMAASSAVVLSRDARSVE